MAGPAAVRSGHKQLDQPRSQLAGHLPERHLLPRADGTLDRQPLAVEVVVAVESLDKEEVDAEPDGAAPVGVAAEQVCVGLSRDVRHRVLVPVQVHDEWVVLTARGSASELLDGEMARIEA